MARIYVADPAAWNDYIAERRELERAGLTGAIRQLDDDQARYQASVLRRLQQADRQPAKKKEVSSWNGIDLGGVGGMS